MKLRASPILYILLLSLPFDSICPLVSVCLPFNETDLCSLSLFSYNEFEQQLSFLGQNKIIYNLF